MSILTHTIGMPRDDSCGGEGSAFTLVTKITTQYPTYTQYEFIYSDDSKGDAAAIDKLIKQAALITERTNQQ